MKNNLFLGELYCILSIFFGGGGKIFEVGSYFEKIEVLLRFCVCCDRFGIYWNVVVGLVGI